MIALWSCKKPSWNGPSGAFTLPGHPGERMEHSHKKLCKQLIYPAHWH